MIKHKPTLKEFSTLELARRHYAAYSADQSEIGAGVSLNPSAPDLLAQLNAVGYYTLLDVEFDNSKHTLSGVFEWDDTTFTVTPITRPLTQDEIDEAEKALISTVVSMRQARVYLSRVGLLDTVTDQINTIGGEALITWEYSQEVQRDNPLVASMGFTEEQLDTMFLEASQL